MRSPLVIGVAVAGGIIVGSVLFALTEYPAWIAFGLMVGAAMGAAAQRLVRPE